MHQPDNTHGQTDGSPGKTNIV